MDKIDRIIKALLLVLLCLVGCFGITMFVHIVGMVWPFGLFVILFGELVYLFVKFYKFFGGENE